MIDNDDPPDKKGQARLALSGSPIRGPGLTVALIANSVLLEDCIILATMMKQSFLKVVPYDSFELLLGTTSGEIDLVACFCRGPGTDDLETACSYMTPVGLDRLILILDTTAYPSRLLEDLEAQSTTVLDMRSSTVHALMSACYLTRYSRGADIVHAPAPKSAQGLTVSFGRHDLTRLTARETAILRLVREGKSNKEIAALLQMSVGTVKSHIHNVMQKTGRQSRVKLALGLKP